MDNRRFRPLVLSMVLAAGGISAAAQANTTLSAVSLMHETRETEFPADGSTVADRSVSFQWPLPAAARTLGAPMDGAEERVSKADKSKLRYRIRYSKDCTFADGVVDVATRWPFYNPEQPLSAGKWFWQYAYVDSVGDADWSKTYCVTVADNPDKFSPPSFNEFVAKLPASHPRVLVTQSRWDDFMTAAQAKPEREWFIARADKVLNTPIASISAIPTGHLKNLKTEYERNAYLTRESRRIVDREEQNCNALIRAYILTKERKYADEAVGRIFTMIDWSKDSNVMGDFNAATVLSLASTAFDSFYDILPPDAASRLLAQTDSVAKRVYNRCNNYLENHIAENHIWQMILRIATMAAVATYGELDDSATYLEYYYNVWLARFPGLNSDGGWHNGDSYFTVNTRTLIELPWFYSQITGYDFFADPWYDGNIMYTIFQQPPFSKSGGNGSSHQNVVVPSSVRVGYLDALAKLKANTYAADFVRTTLAETPDYLKKSFLAKSGDLSWFRLQCDLSLPEGPGLADLPHAYVFPETGLASDISDWTDHAARAMWSFRSSPYGSTSHALANQNAFNTFYGGKPLFYSSGHHIKFLDLHSLLCHRATRAHNTILANGCCQRIGVEGYGWLPRHYVGKNVTYVLGDASNAYGEEISPLWLQRGKESDVEFSPENGWDKNHVKRFRRHIVSLGSSACMFIYDELEADTAISWNYLLHAVAQPLDLDLGDGRFVHVTAANGSGASDAFLFSSGKLAADTTSRFFQPPVNLLRADDKGNFIKYPEHWHFTATSEKSVVYRFANFISTHDRSVEPHRPIILPDGRIRFGQWIVTLNLSTVGNPSFEIVNEDTATAIRYGGQQTVIIEDNRQTELTDTLPNLEI